MGWFIDPARVQHEALALLQVRESRLVVSEQIKAEREASIVDGVVEAQLPDAARRRWAARLREMAEIFRMTRRPEPAAMAEQTATALADVGRPATAIPFARALAARGIEMASEVALGRTRLADVSRAPARAHALMIPGLRVGHVTDAVGLTGCTVILSDAPAVGGVEIRGWAAGVHGLEFLDPRHLVPTLDGVVLAGGSAFGLEAIWGVMRYLEERGVGFTTSQTVVPHVAGAILYDLGLGDPTARPDRAMGHRAAAAARPGPVAEGNVGAGTGASVGKLHGIARATKGGLGCAVLERDGVHLGALMAVNAVGDVRDPDTGRLIAGARDAADGRRLDRHRRRARRGRPAAHVPPDQHHDRPGGDDGGARQARRRASGRPGDGRLHARALAAAPHHRRRRALLPLGGHRARRRGRPRPRRRRPGGPRDRAGGPRRHRRRRPPRRPRPRLGTLSPRGRGQGEGLGLPTPRR